MSNEYWLKHEGKRVGPFSAEQLEQMQEAGMVSPQAAVSSDGRTWRPLAERASTHRAAEHGIGAAQSRRAIPVQEDADPPRPLVLTVLGILNLVVGGLGSAAALFILVENLPGIPQTLGKLDSWGMTVIFLGGIVLPAVVATALVLSALGCLRGDRAWGYWGSIVYAVLMGAYFLTTPLWTLLMTWPGTEDPVAVAVWILLAAFATVLTMAHPALTLVLLHMRTALRYFNRDRARGW
jgi:hypothetical protein